MKGKWRKKVLCFGMALVLAVGLAPGVPLTVKAAEQEIRMVDDKLCLGNDEWNGTFSEAGEYKLMSDIQVSDYISVNAEITLDLNGYGIMGKQEGWQVITVNIGKKLTLKDTNPDRKHYITTTNGRGTNVSDSASTDAIEVTGGYITGGSAGVQNQGTFNMNAGTICGNSTVGGVNNTTSGTFNMNGGIITQNTGYGVYNGGKFTVSGKPVIKGNVNSDNKPCNAYIGYSTDNCIYIKEGFSPNDGDIGITTEYSSGMIGASDFAYSDSEDTSASSMKYFVPDGSYVIQQVPSNKKRLALKELVTVSFDTSGHGTAPEPQKLMLGEIATKPTDPTAAGYTFDGWYWKHSTEEEEEGGESKEVEEKWDFDDSVYDNITLYAKWTKIITDPVLSPPTAKTGLTANGTPQALINEGSTDDGTMEYVIGTDDSTLPESDWSTTIPTGIEAGTYYVWYRVIGDGSHNDYIADKPLVVTIAEAKPEPQIIPSTDVSPSDDPSNNNTSTDDPSSETEKSVEIKGIVKETLKDSSEKAIEGAEVELISGEKKIGDTVKTPADGSYAFKEVLSDGIYNIKATATIDGQTRTITRIVTVVNGQIQEDANITFPLENVNSELVVKETDDSGSSVVSGLAVEGITEEAKRYAEEGKKVTVTLEAQGKKDLTTADETTLSDDEKIIKTEQTNIKNEAKTDSGDQKTLDFLDLKILKTVTDTITDKEESKDRIRQTGDLIRIVIKYPSLGKYNISLYRYHNGQGLSGVQEIGESENSYGEKIEKDPSGQYITAYLKYFSTYAIGYTTTSNSSPGQTTTSSSSSSGSVSTAGTTDPMAAEIRRILGVDAATAGKMAEIAERYGITTDEIALTDEAITGFTTDKDPKGSTFYKLLARVTKRTKNRLTVNWDYIPYADGYMIYGSRCNANGKIYKLKLLDTVDENDITSSRNYVHKKLKAKTFYKYMVVAYKNVGGKKMTVAASKVVHAPTITSASTVAKKIKTDTGSVKLKVGDTLKLTGKEVKADKEKKLKRHRKLIYESENTDIAAVTKKGGKIKAISKGSVDIYVYSANGTHKKIRVTVK